MIITIIICFTIIIVISAFLGNKKQAEDNKRRVEDNKKRENDLEEQKRNYLKKIEDDRNAICALYPDCESFHIGVAGIYYRSRDAKNHIDYMNLSSNIILKHEKRNTHDKFAVAVYADGYKIGYIPAENSEYVSNLVDNNRICQNNLFLLSSLQIPYLVKIV